MVGERKGRLHAHVVNEPQGQSRHMHAFAGGWIQRGVRRAAIPSATSTQQVPSQPPFSLAHSMYAI